MANYTKHYNAKKPNKIENYDVDVANFNNDLWDEKIFEKQDKIVGKSLSTNDFTNAYKSKLDTLKNYDDTKIKSDITNIKQKDTEQDDKLSTLQTENIKLKEENERLREDLKGLPNGTVSGENIDLKDSSEMRVLNFEIGGNSRQEGEPTPEVPVEVQCCGDSGNINVEMCNKNLLNTEIIPVASAGIKTVEFSKDVLTVTSLAKSGYHYLLLNIGSVKKYDGKNLTISAKSIIETKEGYSRVCLCRYKSISPTTGTKNNVYITKNKLDNSLNINSTQESEYDEIGVLIYANANIGTESNTVKIEGLQVEEAIASSYTQHQSQTYTIPTQQPMRAIGEYKDIFIKKDGKWYERHFVKRLILEGTEAKWALHTTGTRRYGLDLSADLPLKIINKYGIGYSSHFEIKNIISSDLIMFLQVELNHFYVGITDINTKWNSTNDLKGWLSEQNNAGAPVYVDYVLETPIDIKCTAEQTEILEKIENEAKTYKNVTHIYSTDEINPNMKVTYFKDIETIIGG